MALLKCFPGRQFLIGLFSENCKEEKHFLESKPFILYLLLLPRKPTSTVEYPENRMYRKNKNMASNIVCLEKAWIFGRGYFVLGGIKDDEEDRARDGAGFICDSPGCP